MTADKALFVKTTTAANGRQIGGSHYKTMKIEHWDFVAANGLDYFQGQITKYVCRWKNKGGVDDLEKARHFIDKYIEIERNRAAYTPLSPSERGPIEQDKDLATRKKVCTCNEMSGPMFCDVHGAGIIRQRGKKVCTCNQTDGHLNCELHGVRRPLEFPRERREHTYPIPEGSERRDGASAGRGYVNQDPS